VSEKTYHLALAVVEVASLPGSAQDKKGKVGGGLNNGHCGLVDKVGAALPIELFFVRTFFFLFLTSGFEEYFSFSFQI
jgi:hypothetical protein